MYSSNGYNTRSSSALFGTPGPAFNSCVETYLDDYIASPSPSKYVLEPKAKSDGKAHSQQRRPSNRDEFDGPH
jgi:hypothetical protein